MWLSTREAVRVGLKPDDVTDFMLIGLPVSIIGARPYYSIMTCNTTLMTQVKYLIFALVGSRHLRRFDRRGDLAVLFLPTKFYFSLDLLRHRRTKCPYWHKESRRWGTL